MSSHEDARTKPVDPEVLQMLADLQEPGEPDLLRELITLFLRDTPERLDALRRALAREDLETTGRAAHSLKGSAANLGAAGLQTLAASAEAAARNRDQPALSTLLASLDAEFAQVRRQLEELLASRPH
jgi:HPt (histidine-containing phosphotransfer) domain-containing protein